MVKGGGFLEEMVKIIGIVICASVGSFLGISKIYQKNMDKIVFSSKEDSSLKGLDSRIKHMEDFQRLHYLVQEKINELAKLPKLSFKDSGWVQTDDNVWSRNVSPLYKNHIIEGVEIVASFSPYEGSQYSFQQPPTLNSHAFNNSRKPASSDFMPIDVIAKIAKLENISNLHAIHIGARDKVWQFDGSALTIKTSGVAKVLHKNDDGFLLSNFKIEHSTPEGLELQFSDKNKINDKSVKSFYAQKKVLLLKKIDSNFN